MELQLTQVTGKRPDPKIKITLEGLNHELQADIDLATQVYVVLKKRYGEGLKLIP